MEGLNVQRKDYYFFSTCKGQNFYQLATYNEAKKIIKTLNEVAKNTSNIWKFKE